MLLAGFATCAPNGLPLGGNQSIAVPWKIRVPAGKPLVFETIDHVMAGNDSNLYIFPNGTIIFFEETHLRLSTPQAPPTRIWKTGKIDAGDLNQLLVLVQSEQFAALNSSYVVFGPSVAGGGPMADAIVTFSVEWSTVNKTVTTYALSTDRMPPPLGDIYLRLQNISANTAEVAQERISQ